MKIGDLVRAPALTGTARSAYSWESAIGLLVRVIKERPDGKYQFENYCEVLIGDQEYVFHTDTLEVVDENR